MLIWILITQQGWCAGGLCKSSQLLPSYWVVLMECVINCYCSFICTNQWICKWVPPSDNLTTDTRQRKQSFLLNSKRKSISFFLLAALPRLTCSSLSRLHCPSLYAWLRREMLIQWTIIKPSLVGGRFGVFLFVCLKKQTDFLSLLGRRGEELLDAKKSVFHFHQRPLNLVAIGFLLRPCFSTQERKISTCLTCV